MRRLSATPLVGLRAALALLAASVAACDDRATGASVSEVEILHWWTAEGEKQAIDSLLELFQGEHPTETVINTARTGSTAARRTILERMIGGQPPDTFQANGGWDLLAWVLYNNMDDSSSKMTPIDATSTAQG